jgi:hypothetical protein
VLARFGKPPYIVPVPTAEGLAAKSAETTDTIGRTNENIINLFAKQYGESLL